MKNIFLFLVLLLAISTNIFGQSSDEQALRQTIRAYQTALNSNDSSAASKLLAESFVMTPAGGVQRLNKLQRLGSVNSGQFKYGDFKNEDVKINITSQGAYVVIKTNVKFKINEKEYSVASIDLFFVKTNENWQLTSECYDGRNCYR